MKATDSPTAPYNAALAKWKATTKRVQPLTADGAKARVSAAQRYADTTGKAAKVAKAKATKASAERIHKQRTR